MAQRILIVDDEPNIVTALEFLLGRGGYEVRTARDGAEAIAAARSFDPQLVVLDAMMPKLSGYEVCRRLRQAGNGSGMKIVMLTARGQDGDVAQGMAHGADLFLTKPFSTQELLAQVKALLAPAA